MFYSGTKFSVSGSRREKGIHPSSLENEEPDEELRREKMRKMAEKIRKVISVEKIQNYVNRYLAEKDELEASQLPLNNEEDFIKLIYVRLYGQRKNMGYVIETLEEREVNGYRFKDFRIRRRRKWNIWKECCKKEKDNFSRVCKPSSGNLLFVQRKPEYQSRLLFCAEIQERI